MDRDIETLFEELENMMNAEWVCEKISDLKQKTLQSIATARAEALREAAERAKSAILNFGISDKATNHYSPMIRRDLVAQLAERAILADKKEELK